jgi:integrase
VVVLKALYQELIAQGVAETNPFQRLALELKKHQSGERRPHSRLPAEAVKALLSIKRPRLAGVVEVKEWVRDLAIMHLFFGAALRRSEVITLRVGDVLTSSEGTAYLRLVRTKSQKVQQVALPDWVASKVLALVDQRIGEDAANDDELCVTYFARGRTQPLSDSTIYRLFKRYCKELGLPDISPHCARVTAITQLLDQGLPHREVQELSRHSSVTMVERYDRKRVEIDKSASKKLKY